MDTSSSQLVRNFNEILGFDSYYLLSHFSCSLFLLLTEKKFRGYFVVPCEF